MVLQKRTTVERQTNTYIYFINSKNANEEGAEWQFQENIFLYDETYGEIVMDFLKSGKVGGVEFVDYI